jgi:hypothetical protein
MMQKRTLAAPAAFLLCTFLVGGCEPIGGGASTEHSCSPSYVDENHFGRIAAQQAGPGAAILWGVYPKKTYVRYVARLYIDSRKLGGGKNQNYSPHGTVNADTVKSKGKTGSVFRIEGETYDADGVRYSYFLRCRLA